MTLGTFASLLLAPSLLLGGGQPAPAPALSVAPPAPVTWEIDPAHSEVTFHIRHVVSRVTGRFNTFSGSIVADPARLAGGSVNVTIQAASVDTNNERRDTHLRSSDFFDATKYPTLTFRSTRVQVSGKKLKVYGDLTIRGVTKPVVLDGEMQGLAGAPGKRRIGFEASTTINRMDYGVSWNRAAEGGGAVLGDDVEITLNVEAAEKV